MAEKVRRTVAEHDWAKVAPGLQVTVSIGLADGRIGLSSENLLAQVDAKLYEAKRTGKNRVAV